MVRLVWLLFIHDPFNPPILFVATAVIMFVIIALTVLFRGASRACSGVSWWRMTIPLTVTSFETPTGEKEVLLYLTFVIITLLVSIVVVIAIVVVVVIIVFVTLNSVEE